MSEMLPLGRRYENMPIPLVPEHTTFVPAGPLAIGVEYRWVTDEILDAAIPEDVQQAGGIGDARPADGLDQQGVSLHVCAADSHDEYLRFDSFVDEPHYHYIVPGSHNIVVCYDEAAEGDFVEWVFGRFRNRLPQMLRSVGAETLASQFDVSVLEAALPAVRQAVDRALAAQSA